MGTGRKRRLLGVIVLATLVATACSSDSDSVADPTLESFSSNDEANAGEASGGSTAGAPAEPGAARAGDAAFDGEALADAVDVAQAGSAFAGRQLARTARLELLVADVDQAAARIRAMVARAGGFIADAEVRGGADGFGVLTLRLPASNLDAAVDELAGLADEVLVQQIGTEDLTEQLTDIGTRVANLEALETELRALLADVRARSSSASEILVVFNQVNDVRLQIERLQAQQFGLQDRVALATVTVDLQPVATATVPIDEPEPSTVSEAWAATRGALGNIADAAIWFAITIVPVGMVLLLPFAVLWGMWKRLRPDGLLADAPLPAAPDPTTSA